MVCIYRRSLALVSKTSRDGVSIKAPSGKAARNRPDYYP